MTAAVEDGVLGRVERAASRSRTTLTSRVGSAVALLIAVLWTVPTAGLLITSFRPGGDIQTTGWWRVFTHPAFTLDNYRAILSSGSEDNLSKYLFNTAIITVPAVIIPITVAAMAAYAFAWMRFPLKNTLFILVFALQIVPIQVTMIPLLTLYVKLGLAGNHAPGGGFYTIWLSHSMFALPLAIYLLHNFMREIPHEVIESARVDGAGHVQIFTRLVLPLMTPAIAAFGVLQFLWVWNDLLVALVFGGGSLDISPLTVQLAQLSGTMGQKWYLLSAGAIVSTIVPLIVFLSMQRFFVRGLLAGSVKG